MFIYSKFSLLSCTILLLLAAASSTPRNAAVTISNSPCKKRGMRPWFTWDSEDQTGDKAIQIEGEYCGTWPLCTAGRNIGWAPMWKGTVSADGFRKNNVIKYGYHDSLAGYQKYNYALLDHDIYHKQTGSSYFLTAIPLITTRADLLAYRSSQMKQLHAIQSLIPLEVPATITFKKPISYSDLEVYLDKVQIINVKYVSAPEGVGIVPYPIANDDWHELKSFEEYLSRKIRSLNGISDFELIKGYVAATVRGSPDRLLEIGRMDKEVFLVDIGASIWLNAYPNAVIESGDDVYFEFMRFEKRKH